MAGKKRDASELESQILLIPPKLRHSNSNSSSVSPSSSDEDVSVEGVPLNTSLWTQTILDKLGVTIRQTLPVQIIKEWSLVTLSQNLLKDVETTMLQTTLCLRNIDYHSLEEVWEITRFNKDLFRLFKPDDFKSHSTLFGRCSFDDFLYSLGCVLDVIEEKREIQEWQYQLLFHKFLQMFGMSSIHGPLMSTKKAQILSRTVLSKPDLICTTSNPRTDRPILFVCEVKNNPPVDETASASSTTCTSHEIMDHLLAQHVGELFVHLDRSATSRAILGMTVERTCVRITSLHVNENTLEKIKNEDGIGSLCYEAELDRPYFFYSKPMNYLKKEDRIELIESLLHIRMMQRKFETEIN